MKAIVVRKFINVNDQLGLFEKKISGKIRKQREYKASG